MKKVKGTRDVVGKTTHVLVQWDNTDKAGTMEFWKSYPSFSPLGVNSFTIKKNLSKKEVERRVAGWEKGGGLSFS